MKPKLILVLTLIVLLPLGALAWLGWRMARQEREVMENRFREAQIGRLRDLNGVVFATTLPAALPASFRLGDLDVFPSELRARRGATTIELSLRDIKILALLHENKGAVISRDTFFNRCWGLDHLPNSRTDQHIAQLRKRIEIDVKTPAIVLTVHGVGYRYDD